MCYNLSSTHTFLIIIIIKYRSITFRIRVVPLQRTDGMHARLQGSVYYLLVGLAAGVWHHRFVIQVDAESDIKVFRRESPYYHVFGRHTEVEILALAAGPYGARRYGRV